MDTSQISKLKKQFDKIIKKYKFNEGKKTQELVDYIISKNSHNAADLATHFQIENNEAVTLLTFFQKGIEFKQNIESK